LLGERFPALGLDDSVGGLSTGVVLMEMLFLLSDLFCAVDRMLSDDLKPSRPFPPYALPCRCFASGLSITGIAVGSYSCFCSLANILLFLTREAFCSLSMDDRRFGDSEESLAAARFSVLNRLDEAGSRPCQNSRGDEPSADALNGDDWNGDESPLRSIFLVA
jgi:hypothetical protein